MATNQMCLGFVAILNDSKHKDAAKNMKKFQILCYMLQKASEDLCLQGLLLGIPVELALLEFISFIQTPRASLRCIIYSRLYF